MKDGGSEWSNLLAAANIPSISVNGYGQQRSRIKEVFDSRALEMKQGGISLLDSKDAEAAGAARDLLRTLASYGIFVVPNGELESWLKHLGADGKSDTWLDRILEKMGSDPSSPDYVKPAQGDVWEFIRGIVAWIKNPDRNGMPLPDNALQ
ncbi:MAG: hypothetical protein HY057_09400 [Rhodospirillales bacterium]|nr:hypothetical protein [Rhodospirillales bacterium]